jgi:hypothetical protein
MQGPKIFCFVGMETPCFPMIRVELAGQHESILRMSRCILYMCNFSSNDLFGSIVHIKDHL